MKSTAKNKILELPRGYISWSQLTMWEKQPKKYKDRYFYGEETFTNKEMRFGKLVAEAIEVGRSDDEVINQLVTLIPRYEVTEKKLEAEIKLGKTVIPLLGYLDTWRKKDGAIREYKTGKTPWTQAMANKHGQLFFYALEQYLIVGRLPASVHLDWIQTQNSADGGIELTGMIQSFEVEITLGDVIRMSSRISKAAKEISEAYKKEVTNIIK